jgi:predicted RNA-binding protein with PIN domain
VLLIDGYNVLFSGGVPRDIHSAREGLVRRIESWCARTGHRARVFFDCRYGPFGAKLAHVEVRFVQVADDAIAEAVAATADRTAYRVVTSDRAVADAARRQRMEVVPSEEFVGQLAPAAAGEPDPAEKRDGISAAEAKAWMRTFGLGGESDEAR